MASVDTGDADPRRAPAHVRLLRHRQTHPTMTFRVHRHHRVRATTTSCTGDLTIRGVTRPVTFELEVGGVGTDPWGNTRAGFTATTLDQPQGLGPRVQRRARGRWRAHRRQGHHRARRRGDARRLGVGLGHGRAGYGLPMSDPQLPDPVQPQPLIPDPAEPGPDQPPPDQPQPLQPAPDGPQPLIPDPSAPPAPTDPPVPPLSSFDVRHGGIGTRWRPGSRPLGLSGRRSTVSATRTQRPSTARERRFELGMGEPIAVGLEHTGHDALAGVQQGVGALATEERGRPEPRHGQHGRSVEHPTERLGQLGVAHRRRRRQVDRARRATRRGCGRPRRRGRRW